MRTGPEPRAGWLARTVMVPGSVRTYTAPAPPLAPNGNAALVSVAVTVACSPGCTSSGVADTCRLTTSPTVRESRTSWP